MNYDIDFQVPFRHRVRFTNDLVGGEIAALTDLIQTEDQSPAKVLVIADSGLNDLRNGQSGSWLSALVDQLEAHPLVQLMDCQDGLCEAPSSGGIASSNCVALIEGGEDCKNDSAYVERILQLINHFDIDRRSYVIAIGGGAVLDAVGYAAAVAHRGIRLIRVPTTTLAQDDSGVGVKNAINYFNKKNWVGTFAVPWGVINDAAVLQSLPDRDFRCGFSEAVKVSLLKSAEDFRFLCEQASAIYQRNMDVAFDAIKRSCVWHLKHITQGGDPFEALEARPLDFGHWSAHKMESLTDFSIRHGEAVGIGVAIDCLYSSLAFGFPTQEVERVLICLQELGLKLWHPVLDSSDAVLEGLEEFRQHLGGRLTVTMLRDVADPINVHEVDTELMKRAIADLRHWNVESHLCDSGSATLSED